MPGPLFGCPFFCSTALDVAFCRNGSSTEFAEHLFNLKFAAKELERNAKKCEKEEKVEKTKLKKASHGVTPDLQFSGTTKICCCFFVSVCLFVLLVETSGDSIIFIVLWCP